MENIFEKISEYIFCLIKKNIQNITKDTVILVDSDVALKCVIDNIYTSLIVDELPISSIINLFLQKDLNVFQIELEKLIKYFIDSFPNSVYFESNIFELLGLQPDEETFEISIKNYKETINNIVQNNKDQLLEYIDFAKSSFNKVLNKIINENIKENKNIDILYIGTYDLDWKNIFNGLPVNFSSVNLDENQKKLLKLSLSKIKGGIQVFFSETNKIKFLQSDMQCDTNCSKLTDKILNLIVSCFFKQHIVDYSNIEYNVEELYNELLPLYENTDYNLLNSCYKNMNLNINKLQEKGSSTGEYNDSISNDDIVINILNKEKLPKDFCKPYIIEDLLEPKITKNKLVIGMVCINKSIESINNKIKTLINDKNISKIFVLIDGKISQQIFTNDKVLVINNSSKNYSEALNEILLQVKNYDYLMFHDCDDPYIVDTNILLKSIKEKQDADVFCLQLKCIGDLNILNQNFSHLNDLYNCLLARRYFNLSSFVFKTRIFDYIQFDKNITYNAQYEFLFRLILSGADFETIQNIVVLHYYEFNTGKHVLDKENYNIYIDYVEKKHKQVFEYIKLCQDKYFEYIEKLSKTHDKIQN